MIKVNKNFLYFLGSCIWITCFLSCQADITKRKQSVELIRKRVSLIQKTLNEKHPVIRLYANPETPEYKAQELAINNPEIGILFRDPINQQPMLNEVFSVSNSRPSDFPLNQAICHSKSCYRVEIYNYARNGLIIALVDIQSSKIISYEFYESMQGDIPPHLAELALAIVYNDSSVTRAYDGQIDVNKSRMQSTKTALNRSKCQRSQHLCVAPTFVKNDKALWTIVDLTDLKVVGTKWTEVGRTGMPLTERIYQNETIMKCYCEVENKVEKEGWSFSYSLTRSDGLRISDVSFHGIPLFSSVKLMDWHVSYSKTEGFGYSDAVGCPEYSNAAVVAIISPEIKPIIKNSDTLGFELIQQYFSEGWPTPCSYNYAQHYEFYKDGSFRPIVASLGRGCGIDGTYRPVTRIALAGMNHIVEHFEKNNWKLWNSEAWILQSESDQYQDGKYIFKIKNNLGNELLIEANKGQFGDGGRGDNAYYYITKKQRLKDEGDADLPTLGPCCNIDYKQGPEKFIEPESIQNSGIVLWYVPQIRNDNRPGNEYCWAESVLENGVYVPKVWPCPSGPKFSLMNHSNSGK